VCSAFLDLRKAFDSLDHVLLLECLNCMGVHAWFSNNLTNHLQRAKSKGSFSSWIPVRGGIPQGSALGPLFIPSICQRYGNLLQFADDTILVCSGDTCEKVERKLSHDLELISKWISQSKMHLILTS